MPADLVEKCQILADLGYPLGAMDLSIKEAATLIGKSERTVRHMAQTGRLPARRIGSRWVIRRGDLDGIGKRAKARKSGASGKSAPESAPESATSEPATAVDRAAASTAQPSSERQPPPIPPRVDLPEPTFTVSFEPATPPAEPGSRDYPNSIRELDTFAIATAILSRVAEARRNPRTDEGLLGEVEQALRSFLQLLADGCHQAEPRRKEALFQEAQSQACTALAGLVHYNLVYPAPDLSRLAERLETHLLASVQELRVATQRRLTWRGRAVTAAEITIERILDGARTLSGGRLSDQIETLDRSLHRALQHAL